MTSIQNMEKVLYTHGNRTRALSDRSSLILPLDKVAHPNCKNEKVVQQNLLQNMFYKTGPKSHLFMLESCNDFLLPGKRNIFGNSTQECVG